MSKRPLISSLWTNRVFIIILSTVILSILIDTSLAKLPSFGYTTQSSLQLTLIIFLFIIIVYVIGQYLVLAFTKSKVSRVDLNFKAHLKLIFKLTSFVQYFLAVLLVMIFFEVVVTHAYDPLLLKITMWISYAQAVFLTAFLSYKFFSWLASHKSYVIFFYGLAVSGLCANALFTILHVTELIQNYPYYVKPSPAATGTYLPYVNPESILTQGFEISSVLSYLLVWLATVVLLRSHSKNLGRIRYWTIVSLPLIYFIIQFPSVILQLFSSYRLSNPVEFGIIYTLFFVMSKPIGGILFAAAFWSTGKRVDNVQIKDFMVFTGYGIFLFFTSNQAIILDSFPYPPFGLSTISFIGLGASLLLIGIYSSAISIAHDATLRSSIRRSVKEESGLLDKIGTSEIENQVVKKAVNLTNRLSNQMEAESGIRSSLSEQEIKEYIEQVIEETKKRA